MATAASSTSSTKTTETAAEMVTESTETHIDEFKSVKSKKGRKRRLDDDKMEAETTTKRPSFPPLSGENLLVSKESRVDLDSTLNSGPTKSRQQADNKSRAPPIRRQQE